MIRARVLSLLAAAKGWLCLLVVVPAAAGPLDLDAGLRSSIFDDNYKLGVGGELGLVQNLGRSFDLGLHLNYSIFRAKTVDWNDATELGGYLTAYMVPTLADQPFEVRLGPHAGAATLDGDWYADLGGDLMAVFKVADRTRFYGAFIPSIFIGENSQSMFRIGFGIQYRLSDGAAAPATGYEGAASP